MRLCSKISPPLTWLCGKISPPLTQLCSKISPPLYAVTRLCVKILIGLPWLDVPTTANQIYGIHNIINIRSWYFFLTIYAVRFPHHLRDYTIMWLHDYAVTWLHGKISPSLMWLCGKISPPLTQLCSKISPPLMQLCDKISLPLMQLCGYAVTQ